MLMFCSWTWMYYNLKVISLSRNLACFTTLMLQCIVSSSVSIRKRPRNMLTSFITRIAGLAVGLLVLTSAAIAAPRFELVPVPPPADLGGMPVIPWVKPGDTAWRQTEPLFDIGDDKVGTKVAGWVAVTNQDILIHVIVHD